MSMNQLVPTSANPNAAAIAAQQANNVRLYGAVFNQASQQARDGVRSAMHARLLAGAALIALKNLSAHGEFEAVCQREFPETPERTLQAWKARAEQDTRNKELREATEAVLLNGEDADARANFEQVADAYFAAKPNLALHAAQEMHLLGNRKPAAPAVPRAKLPRGKSADIARREFETKSRLCFSTLVREVEKAATLKLGEAHCWDVGTTDAELEELDRALVVIRAGLKATLEKRKSLKKGKR